MAADYGISSQGDYGSPAKSGSGNANVGITGSTANVGGIAPVVIGGYKSEGTATATSIPKLALWLAGAAAVVAFLAYAFLRRKS